MRLALRLRPGASALGERRGLLLLFLLLLPLGAFAQGAGDEPAPEAEEAQADEAPPAPAGKRRRGPTPYDGGSIAEAFMQGFREGMQEAEAGKGPEQPPELSDDEAAAVGFLSLCCCFLFLLGLIVLVVVLVKKSSGAAPRPPPPAPAVSPFAAPGGTHLSVVAVAFDARVRGRVEAELRAAGATQSPMSPQSRAMLVRTLCRALLDASENWRAFGYGDKTDFADDAAAEVSFRNAWSDFRQRCLGPGEPNGELCVAVLVLCSRGAVLGTSRLDDRAQARALLQHRMGIAPEALLAADCFFAPPEGGTALSSGDAYRRFPEMQPLGPG